MNSDLKTSLVQFSALVEAHPRMQTLLKGWDRTLVVHAIDNAHSYTLRFEGCRVADLRDGAAPPGDGTIVVKGSEEVLTGIFSGTLNPTSEYFDGRLHLDASESDQVKLDAVTLILWD